MILSFVIALQLQCGSQQWGDSSLNYGTLIYLSQDTQTPQLAYFEIKSDTYSTHPFCAQLQEKMNNNEAFHLKLDSSGKKILKIQ